MTKSARNIKGYGKQIPPDKRFVLIWFLEKGSSEMTALAFYKFYHLRKWRNNQGLIITDWKMRAWEWLWAKM